MFPGEMAKNRPLPILNKKYKKGLQTISTTKNQRHLGKTLLAGA
jgi:hypothetical protein